MLVPLILPGFVFNSLGCLFLRDKGKMLCVCCYSRTRQEAHGDAYCSSVSWTTTHLLNILVFYLNSVNQVSYCMSPTVFLLNGKVGCLELDSAFIYLLLLRNWPNHRILRAQKTMQEINTNKRDRFSCGSPTVHMASTVSNGDWSTGYVRLV